MGNKKKRPRPEHDENESTTTDQFGMAQTLSLLKQDSQNILKQETPDAGSTSDGGDWQTVQPRNKRRKTHNAVTKPGKGNYPAITHSPHARLQSLVRVTDLQSLVLYLLADGPAPQWVSVRHHAQVRKVVVLMVPGLERGMFDRSVVLEGLAPCVNGSAAATTDGTVAEKHEGEASTQQGNPISPDDYYPTKLEQDQLPHCLKPLATIFEHVWPINAPGDSRHCKLHSPVLAMLTSPLPKSADEKKHAGPQPPRYGNNWKDQPTPITEYVATVDQLHESEYTIHPALLATSEQKVAEAEKRRLNRQTIEDGWLDTNGPNRSKDTACSLEDNLTGGRQVYAIDCEMCMTDPQTYELTRISLLSWDGGVLIDELVKPTRPITDYLTRFSGITEAKLAHVTTTLHDIQTRLLALLTPTAILAGHSLNSDLAALKLTHTAVVDTAILYPHPRGPPLKSSLKWLAQRYLSREIQKGTGAAGHDSIEDARAALDLVKVKCQRGPAWGTAEASGESIFKRIARSSRHGATAGRAGAAEDGEAGDALCGRTGGVVDWGSPKRGHGACAKVCISCSSDDEVVAGVKRVVLGDANGGEVPGGGVDFVWARFRELEAVRGWNNGCKSERLEVPADAALEMQAISTDTGRKSNDHTTTADVATMESLSKAVNGTKRQASPSSHGVENISNLAVASTTALESSSTVNGKSIDSMQFSTVTEEVKENPESQLSTSPLATAVASTISRIRSVYDSLPPCTAFIVYSGTGDPRELVRMQAMQAQFKKEYAVKKWDQLSVHWTDMEEQALNRACRKARDGVGFVTVK